MVFWLEINKGLKVFIYVIIIKLVFINVIRKLFFFVVLVVLEVIVSRLCWLGFGLFKGRGLNFGFSFILYWF